MLTLLLSQTALGLVSASPIPGNELPDPTSDIFYAAPSNLSQLKNGDVYNTRQITPQFPLEADYAQVQQLAYKTSSTNGSIFHSVGTLFVPQSPSSEHRLFSYQVWEDSDNLDCSPSYSMAKGPSAPNSMTTDVDTSLSISFALLQGWHVIVPDAEGPTSSFLAGQQEGYAGLDGIRAAENWLGWDAGTPVALYGYSGGASSTAWMTNQHDTYAPELNIVGAVHGGTPINIYETINWLD